MAGISDTRTITAPESAGATGLAGVHPGSTLGRYRLRSLLGHGGMGVVFLADDPTLDRTVAVKVLFPDRARPDEDRLVREGQVMAKLNHPNVVRIYDVGREGTISFVAMEHVRGPTLKAWLEAGTRGVAEVLGVFLQAGRGLAAAHRAGLVHCDFKPANVLIDDDGRVVVTDFGLARRARAAGSAEETAQPSLAALEPTASKTAGICGTPAYMAPEQHAGAPADVRSDVFSFCVALWRALFGEPPFVGDTWGELAQATRDGRLREPARAAQVPGHVRAALERGLRAQAEARWPAMEPLLHALANDPARERRRVLRLAAAILAVAALSATAAGWVAARRRAPEIACGRAQPRFAGIWDDSVRARLRAAMIATGEPQAGLIFDAAARGLDERVAHWEAMRRDSCEATRVRHEQSDSALDQRAACLERKADELDAFVSRLRAPTKATLYGAVDALAGVGDVAVCGDAVALSRRMPLPSDVARRQAIAALEREVLALRAVVDFDQPLPSAAEAQARVDQARGLDYPPLTALALFVAARNQAIAVHITEAERLLEAAIVEAEAGGDDSLRFELERQLGRTVGLELERFADGLHHLERARALNQRSGGGPQRESQLLEATALLYDRWERNGDAEAIARRAVALASQPGVDPLERASALHTLASVLNEGEKAHEAKQLLDEALIVTERQLGPHHPRVASVLLLRGSSERLMRQLDAAQKDVDRGLAIAQAVSGPESFNAGTALASRAMVLYERGQLADAERDLRAAYAIYCKHYGPGHVRSARLLARLGRTLSRAKRYDEAGATLRQALAGLVHALGQSHRLVAETEVALGNVEEGRKRPLAALAEYGAAAAALRAGEGPASKLLRRVYSSMGDVETDLGRYPAAWQHYEAALAVIGEDATGGSHRATLEAGYAESLLKGGRRAEALPHLLRARELLAAIGEREKDYLAEVDRFIAGHFPEAKKRVGRP